MTIVPPKGGHMDIPKITPADFIVVLTGAGISAESGIKTFRDSDGLWENHRVQDVATPEGFHKNPSLVWNFYKQRYLQSKDATPNPAHIALATLENAWGDHFTLVTQNVDGLHSRAGNQRLYEMHGSVYSTFCTKCGKKYPMSDIDISADIPHCVSCAGKLRPDIVWFGEMPYYLPEIDEALKNCSVFISIGTSGQVYPAAYFITAARQKGAMTISVNLDVPENNAYVDYFLSGKAGQILPTLVTHFIGN